ncbi:MAG: ATP-dependent RecD-like DNA helicase [Mycoplasmatales bacterium]
MQKIKGRVSKIIFESSNFYVFSVKLESNEKEIMTSSLQVISNQSYEFKGEYVENPKYGRQFKVTDLELLISGSKQDIIKFLSSDNFSGVGTRTAQTIYDAFKEDSIQIIRDEPNKLKEINISDKVIEELTAKLTNLEGYADLYAFLKEYKYQDYLIADIYNYQKIYKVKNHVEHYCKYLFDMIDELEALTFDNCEVIYANKKTTEEDMSRSKAAMLFCIRNYCFSTGDTCVEKQELIRLSSKYILDPKENNEVLELLIDTKELVQINNQEIMLKEFYDQEDFIARNSLLRSRIKSTKLKRKEILLSIENIEKENDITYADSQKDAIVNALTNNISIITGGPGTGKTTIIDAIIKIYRSLVIQSNSTSYAEVDIALCAPTGRAAQRMKEATKFNAKTIHLLLEYSRKNNNFSRDQQYPLDQNLIIIDEFSMVDINLAYSLLQAIKENASVVIVGDKAQLESVQPGNVLADLIDSKVISSVELDFVYRQSEGSQIASLAHDINASKLVEISSSKDISVINKSNFRPDQINQIIKKSYEAGYTESDVQVLYPTYKGINGIDAINEELTPKKGTTSIDYFNKSYKVGDKVMQLKNNYDYEIFNGDIGFVKKIINPKAQGNEIALQIDFKGNVVDLEKQSLQDLTHAYAISIHKSQGSEFKVIILPIDTYSSLMLKKKLVYTAITRAKDKLILIGDMNVLYQGIKLADKTRNTFLKKMLTDDTTYSSTEYIN